MDTQKTFEITPSVLCHLEKTETQTTFDIILCALCHLWKTQNTFEIISTVL